MTRRKILALTGGGLLILGFGGLMLLGPFKDYRERRAREEAEQISKEVMLRSLQGAQNLVEPHHTFKARLDGDRTTLTITVTNPNKEPVKNLSFEGLTLDNLPPREVATLPIMVAEIAPGASHDIVLHYDRIPWITDAVDANVLGFDWARKSLDDSGTWKAGEGFGGNFTAKGIPITLDPESARILKKQRDDARKASSAAKPGTSKP